MREAPCGAAAASTPGMHGAVPHRLQPCMHGEPSPLHMPHLAVVGHHAVLRDAVASDGVQPHAVVHAQQHVDQGLDGAAAKPADGEVKRGDRNPGGGVGPVCAERSRESMGRGGGGRHAREPQPPAHAACRRAHAHTRAAHACMPHSPCSCPRTWLVPHPHEEGAQEEEDGEEEEQQDLGGPVACHPARLHHRPDACVLSLDTLQGAGRGRQAALRAWCACRWQRGRRSAQAAAAARRQHRVALCAHVPCGCGA